MPRLSGSHKRKSGIEMLCDLIARGYHASRDIQGGAEYSYTNQLFRDGICGPPKFARTLPIYAPFDSTEREQRVEPLKAKNG